ncbi:hypothetical protein [Maribacter flavus]|uniref:TonB-dependent receptor plug domain-containing protein n=1 Tax=Maribacter flavus TaxID=1658664 RepID=A0A5B2TX39_9FLAO|nr:hypothetical protein [Maribacter flavus]KAA2218528.1 hypothetical protein F0361_02590 [Maribacter flavus]
MKLKTYNKVGFILLYLLFSIHALCQGDSVLKIITHRLDTYSKLEGPEKTYLYTDKEIYQPGDTIWYKAYLVDGISHKRTSKSRVAYVELLNSLDSIVAKRMLYIEDTSSYGYIDLPRDLIEDHYKLRTYSRYMLNDNKGLFYQKAIIISRKYEALSQYDSYNSIRKIETQQLNRARRGDINGLKIDFFPESGSLIDKIPSGLAFKISDEKGNPISTEGELKDSQGNFITDFNSNEYGYGIIYFLPKPLKTYFVSTEIDGYQQKFQIPRAKNNGFTISVKNRDDHFLIQVQTDHANTLEGTILIGHIRGKKFFERLEKGKGNKSYAVKLSKDELQDGIAELILFSPDGSPLCERLVFVEKSSNNPRVSIKSSSKIFGNREKLDVTITILNSLGEPLKGDYSMRVTSTSVSKKSIDFKNWLLLNSDLNGHVDFASELFAMNSEESKFLFETLMLTSKLRNFSSEHIFMNPSKSSLEFVPEKGIMIQGGVKDISKSIQNEKAMISLNILSEAFEERQEIDENGRFSFGPYLFNGSIRPILQIVSNRRNRSNDKYNIEIDPQWPIVKDKVNNNEYNRFRSINKEIDQSIIPFVKEKDFEEYLKGITYLDEVIVSEKRKTKSELIEEEINSFTSYGRPDTRIFRDSVNGWEGLSAMDLLARKGFRVTGNYPNQRISLYGGAPGSLNLKTSPLILLDGTPVNGILGSLRASEVLFIDVLRFSSASLYGTRASGGVIAIYTDKALRSKQTDIESNTNITNARIMGFDDKLEFYLPDYSRLDGFNNILKDYRPTIYWNPDVKIDSEGQVKVQFYTNDRSDEFYLEFLGLTDDGEIVYDYKVIEVRNQE